MNTKEYLQKVKSKEVSVVKTVEKILQEAKNSPNHFTVISKSYALEQVEKIEKEGAIIIGKTSQDEFGFGGFSVNTKKIPKNPYDLTRSCGGSSGGAAGFAILPPVDS